MTALVSAAPRWQLTDAMAARDSHPRRLGLALLLALAAHGLGGVWAGSRPVRSLPLPVPVEVELSVRPPPPPEPTPATPVETPKPVPAPAPAPPRAARAPAPPPAAKAGAVLTAAPAPAEPAQPEPFDFTSDPSSKVYGAGVVAVGGTAAFGQTGATIGGRGMVPAPVAKGDALTAAADLSERPRLRDADPCRGYFPSAALADVASATVRVVVGRGGNVTRVDVVSETPPSQGFGAAARTCMLAQRFAPALDRAGRTVATAVNVNVKFSR